jgi:hypothetical protein
MINITTINIEKIKLPTIKKRYKWKKIGIIIVQDIKRHENGRRSQNK